MPENKPKLGARRCSVCGINLPNMVEYQKCPVCDRVTSLMPSATPITPQEAEQLRAEVAFAQYLDGETDEVKTEREKAIQAQIDKRYLDMSAQRAITLEFEAIVRANWTIEERGKIESLERRLPYVRPPQSHE